jgi:sn-glycerol 3-phosphate transport system substrate-binding protein
VQTTAQSRGVRLGYLPQIRDIEDADIENIVSGKMTAKAGLEDMTKRGDALLEKFQQTVK